MSYLVKRSKLPGSGVAVTLSCNLAPFSWDLLVNKEMLDVSTMQAIISLGAKISMRDVKSIISGIQEESIDILKFAIKSTPHISTADLDMLNREALKCKKFLFVYEILLLGTTMDPALIVKELTTTALNDESPIIELLKATPEGCVEIFQHAVKLSELKFAEALIKSSQIKEVIDINLILTSSIGGNTIRRSDCITFVKMILEHGVNPNGLQHENHSLDVVLKMSDDYCEEKKKILSMLIEHGADIRRCKYARGSQRTLLHIATEFALKSGTAN